MSSKSRRQMHGKTFGGIKWSHRPENHNWQRASDKKFNATMKAFRRVAVGARKGERAIRNLGLLLSDLATAASK